MPTVQTSYRGPGRSIIIFSLFYDWQKIPGTTVVQKPSLPPETEIQKRGLTEFVGAVTNGKMGAAVI